VDAFVCSGLTISDILSANDYTYAEVDATFTLMSSDFYITFSTNTPASTVEAWQGTLDAMHADGTYDVIYQKWLAN